MKFSKRTLFFNNSEQKRVNESSKVRIQELHPSWEGVKDNYLPPYLVQVTGEGNTCGETYIKIATSPTCERKKSRKESFVTFYTDNLTSSSFYL